MRPRESRRRKSCGTTRVCRSIFRSRRGDVLRIDETVYGPYDIRVPDEQTRKGAVPIMTLDRADSTIRYRTVTFTDPNEILLLPESIEMMTMIRGSGAPRVRTMQTFTGYQRFVTGGRLVGE